MPISTERIDQHTRKLKANQDRREDAEKKTREDLQTAKNILAIWMKYSDTLTEAGITPQPTRLAGMTEHFLAETP